MRVLQTIAHNTGVALGGVGTGSVEIRPDGLFHEWQIFNTGPWAPNADYGPASPLKPEDVVFVLRTEEPGGIVRMRYLALREQLTDLYSFSWLQCVKAIDYSGTCPVARLEYLDDTLPVRVYAEIFSPFVASDSRSSGTPGFYVNFRIENCSSTLVKAAIVGIVPNVAGYDQDGRLPWNKVDASKGKATVFLSADSLDPQHPSTGNMSFSVSGGNVSFISGASSLERPGLIFYHTGSIYGLKVYSYLRAFWETGKLPNLSPQEKPSLPEGLKVDELSDSEINAHIDAMLHHPVFYDQYHRLLGPQPQLATDMDCRRAFLADILLSLEDIEKREGKWGTASLASGHVIKPGGQADSLFTFSWYFPNHISVTKSRIGHMYENWFTNALEVNQFLTENFADLRVKTLQLADALHRASIPDFAASAISSQLSTMVKCTWWTKPGHFGVWEGLGCCGFHTTDITYQGSFPIISLFPDLQKAQMVHGAKFQRSDGRVHHFFTPDFEAVDNGFDRVDMNQQFVMLAARDYQWTGDKKYLDDLWPHIVQAMSNTGKLDGDGDGLPDKETKRNTYDCWDFEGCPSYISSLWLGSLKSGAMLAREMGEDKLADKWEKLYKKGLAAFENKLWNGSYYILWKDEAAGTQDDCCMSDQVSGDWFSAMSGWGNICYEGRIRTALMSILQHNFRPEMGLINASYPPGSSQKLSTAGNLQQDATWSGIEYTVAALLLHYGMIEEGYALVKDIHDRHYWAGRYFNHQECGPHYYRAMSSWTILNALSGFSLNVPKSSIGFRPPVSRDPWACPFIAPGVLGVHRRSGVRDEIEVLQGGLNFKLLNLEGIPAAAKVSVMLDGKTVSCSFDGGRISGDFAIKAGQMLSVNWSW